MSPDFVRRKVLLVGDASVGKTSLIRRYVIDKFSDEYLMTIGTKVTKKDLRIGFPGRDVDLTLLIWEVLGQKGYRAIQDSAMHGANGVLLVYDLSRPETTESLEDYWIPKLLTGDPAIPMVVVGNKSDLVPSKADAEQELGALAQKYWVQGFLSSAKTGENVPEAFLALGRAVIETPPAARPASVETL